LLVLGAAVPLAACSLPPWNDLHGQFATAQKPSRATTHGDRFVLYSGRMTGACEYDTGASFDIGEDGLYLSTAMSRVFVPASAVKACSITSWGSHADTDLWVESVRVEVALPDTARAIPVWCKDHSIPIVSRDVMENRRKGS